MLHQKLLWVQARLSFKADLYDASSKHQVHNAITVLTCTSKLQLLVKHNYPPSLETLKVYMYTLMDTPTEHEHNTHQTLTQLCTLHTKFCLLSEK